MTGKSGPLIFPMFTDLQSWTSYPLLSQRDLLTTIIKPSLWCQQPQSAGRASGRLQSQATLLGFHYLIHRFKSTKKFFFCQTSESPACCSQITDCVPQGGKKKAALCAAVLNNNNRNTFYGCKHGRRITFLALGDHNRRISCRPMPQQRRNIPPPSV